MKFGTWISGLAVIAAVAFAPAAGAETGVVGYFKFPSGSEPGQVGGPEGVAVNHAGTGGASPGDVYLSDGFRIHQFSPGGVFIRRWNAGGRDIALEQATGDLYVGDGPQVVVYSATGERLRSFGFDVVKSGPGDSGADEQQQLRVIATGGTFTVGGFFQGFGSLATVPIPYDAPAATVEAAINGLAGVTVSGGHVTVTGGPGDVTGSSPYTITFGGALGGDNVDELNGDASELAGGTRSATVTTTVPGGEPEVCSPSDSCQSGSSADIGGGIGFVGSIALAPPGSPNAGNVLIADGSSQARVSEFTPGGSFLRAFGWDVVASGANDSAADEQQQLTVKATGGKFSLSFDGQTTGALGNGDLASGSTTVANVSVASGSFAVGQVITATGIPSGTTIEAIGAGTLTLSQAATSSGPGRALTADDIDYNASAAQVQAALNALPTIGGVGGSVSVAGGPGNATGSAPYTVSFGGTLAGDNVATLTSSGSGLSGAKAVSVSTNTNGGAFEVCIAAAGDNCTSGETGAKLGQFNGSLGGLAEDSTGAVYVTESSPPGNPNSSNFRMQKFIATGPSFSPSLFGADEVQQVSVSASAGQFRLTFDAKIDGTIGFGDLTEGSSTITGITTSIGAFTVGEPIRDSGIGGYNIPSNTVIVALGPNTITMSKPAVGTQSDKELISNAPYTTANLPYDASAAQVEAALNGLPPVGAAGGSVTVSGGPGDTTGSSPYVVTFGGGRLHAIGVSEIRGDSGTVPLSGGSGAAADQVTVATTSEGGPNGNNQLNSPVDVAIDNADNISVLRKFPPADTTCPDGSASPAEDRIMRFDTNGGLAGISVPCMGIVGETGSQSEVVNLTVDPIDGVPYLAHRPFSNSPIFGYGYYTYIFGDLGAGPDLILAPPSDLSSSGVKISGSIAPNGPATASSRPNSTKTTYRVEYRKVGEEAWGIFAPETSVGSGASPVPFTVGVSGLTPKTEYEIRVIVSKLGFPSVVGATQTITTEGAPPTVDAFSSSKITATSAELHARINPLGTETSYHFEYGTTPAYGHSTPEISIGDGMGAEAVQDHIEGLDSVVYHFRVVATNALGTVATTDQTFSFYPEPCPNAAVRQQTGSGSLPDCRAYEIASAADAGSASLLIGGPSSSLATSPSRLSYLGTLGTIPGPWNPPNVNGDLYVATRTVAGWDTRYVGIPADVRYLVGGPPDSRAGGGNIMSDLSLGKFLDWDRGQQNHVCCTGKGSFAPYLWGANGNSLGRLPTNANQVTGGLEDASEGGLVGDLRPSPDFSHYFFSSANVAFAPGGRTSEGGSVYDNDLEAGTVTIASKLANGDDIPREPGNLSDDFMKLPAASTDGSHILIAATGTGVCGVPVCGQAPQFCGGGAYAIAPCPDGLPSHLYVRVGGTLTYDVSRGHLVDYEGMSADGSEVLFTSAEPITDDDNDQSIDLFKWSELGDELTRLSMGEDGVGDIDACTATWIEGCGVEVVSSEGGGASEAGPTDNSIALGSGDVYFYSPEQFVGSNGIPGRRNLYVFRQGEVRYVSTMEADNPLTRIQVSSDGDHAAFITATQLTTYDNDGYREMYSYDAQREEIVCVSCIPSGDPPSADVEGSQNGAFMTDDGRAFFSTDDALVDADTNGLNDVYEYVAGRPQLISSGIASLDGSLAGKAGLVGVSANGVDAFFATYERLVSRDQNAQSLRIYDARTNGGFAEVSATAPCAAADECHGSSSARPATPGVASVAPLGSGGNAKATKQARRKQKQRRRKAAARKRKRHQSRHARQVGNG